MFKSRERREAERQLKIEQEKQRILAEQQRRQEQQKIQQQKLEEELKELSQQTGAMVKSITRWYLGLSLRNKTIVGIGSLVLILAALGQFAKPAMNVSESSVAQPTPSPTAIASPATVQASPTVVTTPATSQSELAPVLAPMTEAEQFKAVVLAHTDGIFALDRVQSMEANELFAFRVGLLEAVTYGINGGVSLDYIKQSFADQLHIQHGMDEQLARNLSNGIIEGVIAWERGERPASTSSVAVNSTADSAIGLTGSLMADNPNARINLRSEPNTNVQTQRYGLVGDQVLIQDSAIGNDGQTWYKVQFMESEAVGWIRGDFIAIEEP